MQNTLIVRIEKTLKKEPKNDEKFNYFLKNIAVVNGREYLIASSFVDDKLLLICELAGIEIVDKTGE